jgi:hypothetical protein
MLAGNESGAMRLKPIALVNTALVAVGALLMTWPAFFNRYPLLYPDSMTYVGDGRIVAQALLLHKLSVYYGMRSFIYSLGILPFHWNVTLWPVVALHALLTAYVIWLVARSILPRQTVLCYLVLFLLLSLLTSLSWFVCLIMPDILGPLLYLCIYLLVFARESLSRVERLAVMLIAWWAVTSHMTHLMLATGTCILLALLLIFLRKSMRPRWRGVGEVALIVMLAAGAQLALHAYLYGEPSLDTDRPPYLMARVIADGPGRRYLEEHCGEVKFAICGRLQDLPDNSDDFIWADSGIWQSASDETAKRLRQEEIPFVLATLRAYPREQISKSAANFWEQLTTFGFELDANDWILKQFDSVVPGERSRYLQSRLAQNAIPFDFFMLVHGWTVIASLVVIGLFIPRMWRRRPPRLLGLGGVIVFTVVANAFVTGVLSMVEDRYQSRVVWLVPLLAGVLVLDWLGRRKEKRA